MEQISPFFKLISHPDRTLQEHLDSCNDISEKLLDMKFVSDSFFNKNEIEQMRKLLIYFHDFGKATDYFQSKIIDATVEENNQPFIQRQQEYINYFNTVKKENTNNELYIDSSLSNHAKLGAYFLFSNYSNENKVIEYILLKVIRRHHGYLNNLITDSNNRPQILLDNYETIYLEKQLNSVAFDSYQKILLNHGYRVAISDWENIKTKFISARQINKVKTTISQEKNAKYFFLQHYLFSLLLSADKGDMMLSKIGDKWSILKTNSLFDITMVDFYKNNFLDKTQKEIDKDREGAYQQIAINAKKYSAENFFSITLPTGMGKTFCSYNAAIILQNEFLFQSNGKNPRIIYCLPFTSIIDQNSEIITDIVKSFGNSLSLDLVSKHHHLSNYNDTYNDIQIGASEAEYLTEGWEQEFIVTTFVQLLESIFTNKNRALRKFHNITNAIIILDEVQNIPPKYYELIELVFTKMAEYFNTKFIFVTATQPVIFSQTPIIELTDITREKTKYYFEKLQRIIINQSLLKQYNYQSADLEKDLLPIFLQDITDNIDKSFLFIFNTIAQAQFVYNKFYELYKSEPKVIFISGSILPKRRKQLIQLIKRNIDNKKRQIIVSTQVVEAGVDIDLDIVYRDFAPLDCINQSAGRCNRNGEKGKGYVKLFNTGKHSRIYDSTLINITLDIFKQLPDNIEEKEIYHLSNTYFKDIWQSISNQSNISNHLIEALYNLELETIQKDFKLIKEQDYYYNVFIAYNKNAIKIWKNYCIICGIQDFFERKQAMKKLQPKLLQYVTRFPKSKYNPPPKQKDNYIINEREWETYYDLKSGFKLSNLENTCMLF